MLWLINGTAAEGMLWLLNGTAALTVVSSLMVGMGMEWYKNIDTTLTCLASNSNMTCAMRAEITQQMNRECRS